jgi:peroxiredoxin Q/BCP
MAQLRQDYDDFVDRETEVIAVGPDSQRAFNQFWERKNIPYIGLADPDHQVAKLYEQEVNLLKFGRIPAQMIVDKQGIIRYVHYSHSMSDIPDNEVILEKLDEINNKE